METLEDGGGDGVQGGEDVFSAEGVGSEAGAALSAIVEEELHVFDRSEIGEVAFVVLEDEGDGVDGAAVEAEIGLEVLHGLEVVALAIELGIGDKNDAIGLMQDELHGGVVDDLAGDGVEVETDFVAGDGGGFEGEKVEEEGAVAVGGKGDEVAATGGVEAGVDAAEVGGFAAERGAAIDDFETDRLFFWLDGRHCGMRGGWAWISVC